jgi:glycine betaine/proline transport system permease protein
MDWLTTTKIPVGASAKTVFDWLKANAAWLFRPICRRAGGADRRHPLAVAGAASAGAGRAVRGADLGLAAVVEACLWCVLGLLFILNQGYWKPTTESLTLVLSACVVCMGVGVPIGIAAAHRPRLYRGWCRCWT